MPMIHAHRAFGLVFHSPFPCPGLPGAPLDAAPDVQIVEGPVPASLPDCRLNPRTT